METNLSYGGIPYNHSFVIDEVYDNRAAMDKEAADDGVFVGRYVLVSYTNEALNQDEKIAIEVALNGNNPAGVYAGIITKNNVNNLGNRYNSFVTNYKTDREKYQNNTNYDKTVWRKYYRGGKQVYELVATLNSGLAINVQGVQPEETVIQIVQDENNNNIIGTKLGFGLEEKTVSGQKQKHLVLFSTPITGGTTKTEVARLDVTELIKDSFLTGVNYNNQTHTLTFKIKDEYGGQFETDVDIDIMNPGDGIDISTGFNEQEGAPAISIDLNDNPGFVNYLQLNEQGLTTNADLAEVIEFYTSAFSSLEQAEYYAQNNNKAYVGQVLTVAEEGNVRQYIIADNNKTLQLNGGGFRKILPLESVAGEGIEIKPQTSTVLFSINSTDNTSLDYIYLKFGENTWKLGEEKYKTFIGEIRVTNYNNISIIKYKLGIILEDGGIVWKESGEKSFDYLNFSSNRFYIFKGDNPLSVGQIQIEETFSN